MSFQVKRGIGSGLRQVRRRAQAKRQRIRSLRRVRAEHGVVRVVAW